MATTEKLGMRLIEGSDLVDPNVINDNFKIVDNIGTDYILESGNSGDWWYRKWASGRAECGVDHAAFANVVTATQLSGGAIYASRQLQFPAFPKEIGFIGDPLSIIEFKYSSLNANQHIVWILNTAGTNTDRPPNFAIVATASNINLGTCYVGCYTLGRWK